jgi:hypothetical protein
MYFTIWNHFGSLDHNLAVITRCLLAMGVDPAGVAIGALAGAIAANLLQNGKLAGLLKRLGRRDASLEERSTTSSAGGGAAAYETRKAVDEYLQFHFGAASDILPYAAGPKVMTVAGCAAGVDRLG